MNTGDLYVPTFELKEFSMCSNKINVLFLNNRFLDVEDIVLIMNTSRIRKFLGKFWPFQSIMLLIYETYENGILFYNEKGHFYGEL